MPRLRSFIQCAPVVGLLFLCGSSSSARHTDTEEDLLSRIEREQNPVKKAKYQMRLGRIKLMQAIDAFDHGNLERCKELLVDYLDRMKGSWSTLRGSGRQAVRQPQGFKDLDIALREDARLLEDLKRRVPYMEREPVEKTVQEVDRIRAEVLRALFPAEHGTPAKKKSAASQIRSEIPARNLIS